MEIFLLLPLRSRKSDKFKENNKKIIDLIPKMKQKRLRAITLQRAIEKCPTLL